MGDADKVFHYFLHYFHIMQYKVDVAMHPVLLVRGDKIASYSCGRILTADIIS